MQGFSSRWSFKPFSPLFCKSLLFISWMSLVMFVYLPCFFFLLVWEWREFLRSSFIHFIICNRAVVFLSVLFPRKSVVSVIQMATFLTFGLLRIEVQVVGIRQVCCRSLEFLLSNIWQCLWVPVFYLLLMVRCFTLIHGFKPVSICIFRLILQHVFNEQVVLFSHENKFRCNRLLV